MVDEIQPVQGLSSYTPDQVRALFERCAQMQEELSRASPRDLARQAIFDERKIPSLPKPEVSDPLIWRERYQELVQELKTADDVMIWYWLGQWLKSEGIREPDKIVPATITKKLAQRANISGADIRNARLLRIWFPYTEPLVRKTQWLRQDKPNNLKARLKELGYESAAVELVTSKEWQSAVEFTCEWVAARTQAKARRYEKETLRNSYTRYLQRWWYDVTKCVFCKKEATLEYWFREEPIPYCPDHGPDRLPTSEGSAWPDRSGRRWWRRGIDIRYTMPA